MRGGYKAKLLLPLLYSSLTPSDRDCFLTRPFVQRDTADPRVTMTAQLRLRWSLRAAVRQGVFTVFLQTQCQRTSARQMRAQTTKSVRSRAGRKRNSVTTQKRFRSVVSHELVFAAQNNTFGIFSVQKVRVSPLKFSSESVLWLIQTRAAKKFLRGSCNSIPIIMWWGFEWRLNYLVRELMHLCGRRPGGTQQRERALLLGLMR